MLRLSLLLCFSAFFCLASLACGGNNEGDDRLTASATSLAADEVATPVPATTSVLSVVGWAEEFCGVQQAFAAATVETRALPTVGPGMTFEERKARALRIWPNWQAAYAQMVVEYNQFRPPEPAVQFHAQSLREATEREKFYRETLPLIQAAQTHADIDAVNLQLAAVATPLAQSGSTFTVPQAVRTAIDSFVNASECGILTRRQ